jgi:hypothetical protein
MQECIRHLCMANSYFINRIITLAFRPQFGSSVEENYLEFFNLL